MADIFISYANEDREVAAQLAQMLGSAGWRVWWDRRIPAGSTWRSVLEDALREMRCLVVLWSENSVQSPWVTEEAEEARRLGKTIVPVLLQRVEPPIGFRAIQAADLVNWNGSIDDPAAQLFIADLKSVLGGSLDQPSTPNDVPATEKIDHRSWRPHVIRSHLSKIIIAAVAITALLAGRQIWLNFRQEKPTPLPDEKAEKTAVPSLMNLAIRAERKELKPSEKMKLELSATYSDGKQNQVRDGIAWSSSAPEVATVSDTGDVMGLKAGTTDIKAKIGDVVSSAWTVNVKAVEPAPKPVFPVKLLALRLSAANRELLTKEKVPIRVKGWYSDNAERDLSGGIEWQISDHAIASVSLGRELEALRPGKVEVVARSGDLRSAPLTFVVKEPQTILQPTKPAKTNQAGPPKLPIVSEQAKAGITGYIDRAESFRQQGNYVAALAELEKARTLDPLDEGVRKEIEQTKRACNAERVLGNKLNC